MSDDFDSQFEDDEFDDEFDEETEPNPEEEQEFEEDEFGEEEAEQDFEDESGDDEDYDKPVAEGDVVEVEVEDLGSKGDGIARVEGFVVFVPGGEVGESYEVEITSVGRKFAFAEIVE
ncbi:MAG: TRAM domain-containing protein [Candidatus Nanohaloarchaea archaeon]